jgi:hypothetical protein
MVGPGGPGSPTDVRAEAGLRRAIARWEPPAIVEGPQPSRYTALASPGGRSCEAPGTGRSCAIPGLSNSRAYRIAVVATYPAGAARPSRLSAPVRPWAPLAILNVRREPRAIRLDIRVSAPGRAEVRARAPAGACAGATRSAARRGARTVTVRCVLTPASRLVMKKRVMRVTLAASFTTLKGVTFGATRTLTLRRAG